ncbi:MAG TPA: histidinol-phosphate transaminase [Thermoanaerobaculia bacterium]|jgi:histidinol-phosphate aminotransferase|nr:histidinol-phosphate transaminase [Thermoanaerobaculia bacterium]
MSTPISRRRFAALLGLGAASAALRPSLVLAQTAAATAPASNPAIPANTVVRLSSNENPYGPSPAALDAMRESLGVAWRYPDERVDALAAVLAKLHGVAPEQILFGSGSSEILRAAGTATLAPDRPLVLADSTFEAIRRSAKLRGAEIVPVPLTADFRHDLPKMLAARERAGLIYLCNPNNPTGSLTPKAEVRTFLSQVPKETTVLIDEAYFHFANSPDYETVIPLVAQYPNLIVARTFSKIYGLAGMRLGYAVAQAGTIERLAAEQAWDNVNVAVIEAARASLADGAYIEKTKRLLLESRRTTMAALEAKGLRTIPSSTNFFMVDLKKDVRPVIAGLKKKGVEVGRFFPALPNHLRVTVGTGPQMERFLGAFGVVVGCGGYPARRPGSRVASFGRRPSVRDEHRQPFEL